MIPLKAKMPGDADWRLFDIPQSEYPFLFTLPIFDMPELLNGPLRSGARNAVTNQLWLRAPHFSEGLTNHLQWICQKYGFAHVQPEGAANAPDFCLLLAKIAHSFAVAELGFSFIPYLRDMIRNANTSEIAAIIGGKKNTEPRTAALHELSLENNNDDLIVVRIRILAHFEAPTYFVVAGRRA